MKTIVTSKAKKKKKKKDQLNWFGTAPVLFRTLSGNQILIQHILKVELEMKYTELFLLTVHFNF